MGFSDLKYILYYSACFKWALFKKAGNVWFCLILQDKIMKRLSKQSQIVSKGVSYGLIKLLFAGQVISSGKGGLLWGRAVIRKFFLIFWGFALQSHEIRIA